MILGTHPVRESIVVGSCQSPTPRKNEPDCTCVDGPLLGVTSSLFSMSGPTEGDGEGRFGSEADVQFGYDA